MSRLSVTGIIRMPYRSGRRAHASALVPSPQQPTALPFAAFPRPSSSALHQPASAVATAVTSRAVTSSSATTSSSSSSSSSVNSAFHRPRPRVAMRTRATRPAGSVYTEGPAAAAATSVAGAASQPAGSAQAVTAPTPAPAQVAGGGGGGERGRSAAPASSSATSARDDFATDQRPIILFDGVCNLCNGGVNFMLDNDPRGAFRLAALQSPAGRRLLARCGRRPDDISSIVLVERARHFIRSEAILRIGAALRVPLPLLAAFGFPVPLPLRDAFYDAVANNRYSFFGRTDACRLGDADKFANRFIVD